MTWKRKIPGKDLPHLYERQYELILNIMKRLKDLPMVDPKDWIRIEENWAYWVDADSFEVSRVKNYAPINSIMILKTEMHSRNGRSYVNTSYGLVSENGMIRIRKKDVNEILSNRVVDYIQRAGQWPPCLNYKRVLKSGEVELLFTLTEYDSFTLKITSKMIEGNPFAFLLGLKLV